VSGLSAFDLAWLNTRGGLLQDARGEAVRLLGLRSPGGAANVEHDLRDAAALLADVAPGRRCIAVSLGHAAQMKPAALAALDARIAQHAAAGIYTLLRLEARLWLHGHHLRVARRYAQEPAVLFALLGRKPLAARLWAASLDLHRAHPRALVWLPIESAQAALAADAGTRASAGTSANLGWLWDAARPQGPRAPALAGALRQPVLLDGWSPSAHSPMADDRLMSLCRQGGIGWLAQCAGPWQTRERGTPVLSRAARVLQRAIHLSGLGAPA